MLLNSNRIIITYNDDIQGHIGNASFQTVLAGGRPAILVYYPGAIPLPRLLPTLL